MRWKQYVKQVFKKYEPKTFITQDREMAVAIDKPLPSAEDKLDATLEIECVIEMLFEAHKEFAKSALEGKN